MDDSINMKVFKMPMVGIWQVHRGVKIRDVERNLYICLFIKARPRVDSQQGPLKFQQEAHHH